MLASFCQSPPPSAFYVTIDDHDHSILAVFEAYRAVDHVVVQTLELVSLACAVMTVSFSAILVAAFHAYRVDLEAQDAERLQDVTGDVNSTVSSVNYSIELSFTTLTFTVSSRCSTPVHPGVSGGTTTSLSLNPLCGWHGPSLHESHQHSPI